MQADQTEVLGLVAGFVGSFAFAPQALKIMRDRDARSVSAISYTMVLIGALLWGTYGVFRGVPSIILWNAVAGLLASTILVLKLRRAPTN
jgi:MtN3 and saliva related transmembrane protein